MKIFLAADHRGFDLKEKLREWLKEKGYAVEDCGNQRFDPADDYPDFAASAATKVAEDPAHHRGVLLCGSGIGMDVAANKFPGLRATVVWNTESAAQARSHDDVNAIAIAADWVAPEEASEIVRVFLETPFSGEERHVRRIKKIQEIEEQNFR